MKKIIINADDFGLCESVNKGILECLHHGIVSDLSFMINHQEFEHSSTMLKQSGIMKVGFHLNLTVGKSVLGEKSKFTDNNSYYLDFKRILIKILMNRINMEYIYNEIKAQMNLLISYGYKITHIDSHQNIHLLPSIMKTLMRLNKEFGLNVPIRMPYGSLHNILRAEYRNLFRIAILNLLTVHCCFRTKYHPNIRVVGIDLFDNTDIINSFDEMSQVIRRSPFEIYEIPVHPGYPSDKLLEYDWYCDQRLIELDLLKDKIVLPKIKDFRIASFNELCRS